MIWEEYIDLLDSENAVPLAEQSDGKIGIRILTSHLLFKDVAHEKNMGEDLLVNFITGLLAYHTDKQSLVWNIAPFRFANQTIGPWEILLKEKHDQQEPRDIADIFTDQPQQVFEEIGDSGEYNDPIAFSLCENQVLSQIDPHSLGASFRPVLMAMQGKLDSVISFLTVTMISKILIDMQIKDMAVETLKSLGTTHDNVQLGDLTMMITNKSYEPVETKGLQDYLEISRSMPASVKQKVLSEMQGLRIDEQRVVWNKNDQGNFDKDRVSVKGTVKVTKNLEEQEIRPKLH